MIAGQVVITYLLLPDHVGIRLGEDLVHIIRPKAFKLNPDGEPSLHAIIEQGKGSWGRDREDIEDQFNSSRQYQGVTMAKIFVPIYPFVF